MSTATPRLLVIDTSGPTAVVEAWIGAKLLAHESFGSARHVQGLTPRLKSLLATVAWTIAEINAIVINIGPGSFTGIRVGLATAKALAYVDGQKLIGVDCFDAWAAGVPFDESPMFDVVTEGQLQTVNVVRYELENGERLRLPLRTMPRDKWAGACDPKVAVIGASSALKALLPKDVNWIDAKPQTAVVGLARYLAGRFDDPMILEPYYVRPSSAEEKWDAR